MSLATLAVRVFFCLICNNRDKIDFINYSLYVYYKLLFIVCQVLFIKNS